jgi:hypothetical protein
LIDNADFQKVLYLRSFNEDKVTAKTPAFNYQSFSLELLTTEEEQLAKAVKDIGEMVAIGIPGEFLPTLGAEPVYTDDDTWQSVVQKIMSKCKLVILKLGNTPGFFWEMVHTFQNARPEQVVFLIPHDKVLYEKFIRHLSKYIKHKFPEYVEGMCRDLSFGRDE